MLLVDLVDRKLIRLFHPTCDKVLAARIVIPDAARLRARSRKLVT